MVSGAARLRCRVRVRDLSPASGFLNIVPKVPLVCRQMTESSPTETAHDAFSEFRIGFRLDDPNSKHEGGPAKERYTVHVYTRETGHRGQGYRERLWPILSPLLSAELPQSCERPRCLGRELAS